MPSEIAGVYYRVNTLHVIHLRYLNKTTSTWKKCTGLHFQKHREFTENRRETQTSLTRTVPHSKDGLGGQIFSMCSNALMTQCLSEMSAQQDLTVHWRHFDWQPDRPHTMHISSLTACQTTHDTHQLNHNALWVTTWRTTHDTSTAEWPGPDLQRILWIS